jgi:arylsulfatase A-like enzyme
VATLFATALVIFACGRSADEPAEDLAAQSGPRPVPPVQRVVLVTIDTLRADHLSTYGYPIDTAPFLDSLADESVVFTRAFAHSSTTRPSHASILTALYPLQHRVQNNTDILDESFLTLAELLHGRGFRTAAFVSSISVHGESNLGQGFEIFEGPTEHVWKRDKRKAPYRRADETTDLAIRWLESQATRGEFFLWVHYFDPHRPHQPPERHLDAVLPRDANEREDHVEFLETQHRLDVSTVKLDDIFEYDAEIRFVDAELERLYRALDDRGLNDGAMWIITSDHGQGLGNHGWFGHHKNIYNEQIRAPLVVHFPGHPRRDRVDEIVEHVDIVVTLADLLGADLDAQPAPIQGRSLVPLLRGEATGRHREYAFGERRRSDVVVKRSQEPGERYSLQNREYKYLWFSEGPDEFYRLTDDPYETRDLIDDDSLPSKDRLRETLLDLVTALRAEGEAEVVSDEVRERLKALGYVD